MKSLIEAIKPFYDLVRGTSGRIPYEKLSGHDWNSLWRAYEMSTAFEDQPDGTRTPVDTTDIGVAATWPPAKQIAALNVLVRQHLIGAIAQHNRADNCERALKRALGCCLDLQELAEYVGDDDCCLDAQSGLHDLCCDACRAQGCMKIKAKAAKDAILQSNFKLCDIPSCNCGGFHPISRS